MDWHRSEPRDVRPFFQTQLAEEALVQSGIRLFKDGEISQDESFDVDEPDFHRLEPTVIPVLPDTDSWIPKSLADNIELLIIVRQSFLKRSLIVARYRIGTTIPAQFAIDKELLANLGGGRNFHIILAVCLAQDCDHVPGFPFIAGHWLAHKTFSLKSRHKPDLFDVRPRTDEEWVAAGYPAKTFLLVDYQGGIAEEPEDGKDAIATVWIHKTAYDSMLTSPLGKALQPLLAAEITCKILQASLNDWEKLETPPPRSPLAKVLKRFKKIAPLSLKQLRELVSTRPAALEAQLQHHLNVVRAMS